MSWVNDDEDDEFIVHDTPAPNREKILLGLRYEIIELSLYLATSRRLGIENPNALGERRLYIDRAKAVKKAMEGEKVDAHGNSDICDSTIGEYVPQTG